MHRNYILLKKQRRVVAILLPIALGVYAFYAAWEVRQLERGRPDPLICEEVITFTPMPERSGNQPGPQADSLPNFDPNKASQSELEAQGLPTYLAQRIVKYRNAGGQFREKADLKKIYGLQEDHYQQLADRIVIVTRFKSESQTSDREKYQRRQPNPLVFVDVNRADKATWQKLHGIGPYYADRILRFRESLGGFVSIDQVGDTYRLPDSVFQAIRPYLQHSPIQRKLAINKSDWETLENHPYISRRQATIILRHREQGRMLDNKEDLHYLEVFSEEDIRRLLPYIDFSS